MVSIEKDTSGHGGLGKGGATSWPSQLGKSASDTNIRTGTIAGARPSSGSTSALAGNMRFAIGDEEFNRLDAKDIEMFTFNSTTKARKIIRNIAYLEQQPAEDVVIERVNKAIQPKSAATAPLEEVPKLDRCLEAGAEALNKRALLYQRKKLINDDAAAYMTRKGNAKLDWIDVDGLTHELDQEEVDACSEDGDDNAISSFVAQDYVSPALRLLRHIKEADQRSSGSPSQGASSPASRSGAGRAMSEASRMGAGRMIGLSASKWLDRDGDKNGENRDHPALRKRRWPSLQKFERFYQVPEEHQPPKKAESTEEQKALPQARPTIAGIEESTSFGAQAYLWPALFQTRYLDKGHEQIPLAQQPRACKAANIFEAAAIYRKACEKLGTKPVPHPPVFGERVEICDMTFDGTQQCYAIAEAIRACAAKQVSIVDSRPFDVEGSQSLEDMGAARIVEAAIRGGRLASLHISGAVLCYRTCAALHDCLRMRGGSSLTELRLSKCGLGGDLDDGPTDLPAFAANAYARGEELLRRSVEVSRSLEFDGADATVDFESTMMDSESRATSNATVRANALAGSRAASNATVMAYEQETQETLQQNATPLLLPLFGLIAQPGSAFRRLDLSDSALSFRAVDCLSQTLVTSPIEALNLSKCNLGDDSIDLIAKGIEKNRHLLELLLRKNQLSGEFGATNRLIDSAGRHIRLAHLDLAENELAAECVHELCSAFKWSCSLVAVHLLGAGISGASAAEIANAIRKWTVEHATDPTLQETEWPTLLPNEEFVVCRALHVRGLSSWRVVAPDLPPKAEQAKATAVKSVEKVAVPQSWMPPCCWICSKCANIEYRWVVPDRGVGDDSGTSGARVFVRPSFANFTRVELARQRVVGAKRANFAANLLVPPGQHCHIFDAEVGNTPMLLCSVDEVSVDHAVATLTEKNREHLSMLFRKHRYNGPVNVLPRVDSYGFTISEQLALEVEEPPESDPWADDPVRKRCLQECFAVDLKHIHMAELCHVDEEEEAKQMLWSIYQIFYETYVIFAGRSQWPLVRQVDVYGFFEEAHLLNRRGPGSEFGGAGSTDSADGSPPTTPVASSMIATPSLSAGASPKDSNETVASPRPQSRRGSQHPLMLQDVQQMLVQTIATRRSTHRESEGGTSISSRRAAAIQQRTREGAPITRPQFVEVLLRTALILKGPHQPSASKAFQQFAESILIGRVMLPPLSPFPRGLAVQVGEVCDTLLARRKTIREAWERFGSCESDFQSLSQLLKLCDRSFTAKHVASIYALARRPHADFKSTGKAVKGLAYDEFCEAIARLSLIWQRRSTFGGAGPAPRPWPPQPQVGQKVKQRAMAARLDAFLGKLAERLRPAIRTTPF